MSEALLAGADWPLFGWSDDIRPALGAALAAGRPSVLATLFRVEGSAPRGPGAQMLFDAIGGIAASGYFSGDCIEGDVARHAAEVLADGVPKHLHYGTGSPWIDIRLRCGGALHVFVERIAADSAAAAALIGHARARRPCTWHSDGRDQRVTQAAGPLLSFGDDPLRIARRYDPPRRLIVSGGDPGRWRWPSWAPMPSSKPYSIRPGRPRDAAALCGIAIPSGGTGRGASRARRRPLDRLCRRDARGSPRPVGLPLCPAARRRLDRR